MRVSFVAASVLAVLTASTAPASCAAVERRHPIPLDTLVRMTLSFNELSASVHNAANSKFATDCLAHLKSRSVTSSQLDKRNWLDDVLKVVTVLEPIVIPLITCNTASAPTIGGLIGHAQAALLRSDLTKLKSAVDKCAPGTMPTGGCALLVEWVGHDSKINCTAVLGASNSMMEEMRGLPLIGNYFS